MGLPACDGNDLCDAGTFGKLAIDTGYESSAVYGWARAQGFEQVAPIKGLEGFNRATPVSGPTFVDATIGGRRLRRGARLWSIATATFKTETYRFLRLERPSDEDRALGVCDPPGIVPHNVFMAAQEIITARSARLSDEELLEHLKQLYADAGEGAAK